MSGEMRNGWRPQRAARRLTSIAGLIATTLAALAAPAAAAGPIQLQQLELAKGAWQIEYYSLVRRHAKDEHSLEIMTGVSDRLALGVEVDNRWSGRKPAIEGVAPTVEYRLTSPTAAIGIGILGQIEIGTDLRLDAVETRLIVERRARSWAGHANLVLRRSKEEERQSTALFYCWSIGRTIAPDIALGVEGSGGLAQHGGPVAGASAHGHFIGPALSIERDLRGRSIELGIGYLRRLDRPGDALRVVTQVNF